LGSDLPGISTLFMGNTNARLGGRIHVDPEEVDRDLAHEMGAHTCGT